MQLTPRAPRTAPRAGMALTACLALYLSAPGTALAAQPTIKLFPTTVVENLKESAETARGIESGMAPLIQQMEEQMKLFQESKCEGNEQDPGCTQIKKAVANTYVEMLDGLKAQLPRIEQAMRSTNAALGKRIRGELGGKMTPRDLARMIEGEANHVDHIREVSNRKRGRMSTMLSKYHKLVAMGSSQGDSMPILAMDIYLDSKESLDLIESIRSEIDRAQTPLLLGQVWGFGPTDEMVSTVDGVKALLFGDEEDAGIPDMRIQGREPDAFDDRDLRF